MRLLICAGGSGGGVYPALAILQALALETGEVLWVGGQGGMEAELVNRMKIPYTEIPAAGVHGVGLRALPGNVLHLGRGYARARRVIRDFRPEVLLFTGGYVAVPVALAGRRIPSLLYVPDLEPGLALKTLARFADHITLIAEESRAFFPPRTHHARLTVTGHPARKDLAGWTRAQARESLSLQPDLPTLLVFGGSKGARSLNRGVLTILATLLAEMQLVHLSGALDWPEVEAARAALPAALAARYRAFPYLHEEMGAAYAAADLVLSRAGASAVGEFPLFRLPAVLVPYPYAWRYQHVNAEFLARQGAAVVIEDAGLPARLLPTLQGLMRDPVKRNQMSAAMGALARPQAAQEIAGCVRKLAAGLS